MYPLIDKEKCKKLLSWAKGLNRSQDVSFNPMSEFVPYVKTKEIVHSMIISELLNPKGNHGKGYKYLKAFFQHILPAQEFDDFTNFYVTRERKVSRVLTLGGVRSIDIFIEYLDKNGNEHAIIIENKLNHAEYQYLQIEDYVQSVKQEGFNIDAIVTLHDRSQPVTANSIFSMDAKIPGITLYPKQLSEWIKEVDNTDHGIGAYADYLMLLHNQNIPYENSNKMINLEFEEIKDLYNLKESFDNLKYAKNDYIVREVRKAFPIVKSQYSKLDEGCKLLQLWNSEDYIRNHFWIGVYSSEYPVNSKGEEPSTDVYIYTKDDKPYDSSIVEKLGYTIQGGNEGYAYFKAPGNASSFYFFNKDSRRNMIDEILRLLNGLHQA